jgi:hypothetical protein
METETKIDPTKLEIWRESLTHLRHLSDEVWKRFQLFLWLDFIFFLLAADALQKSHGGSGIFLILLALSVAFIGRYILQRNRIYYLQMLAKKSLLEDELGLYATKLSGTETDLAFPWRLTPEVVSEIKKDFDAWIQKSIRPTGSIARWLFIIYEAFIAIYLLGLFLLLIRMLK